MRSDFVSASIHQGFAPFGWPLSLPRSDLPRPPVPFRRGALINQVRLRPPSCHQSCSETAQLTPRLKCNNCSHAEGSNRTIEVVSRRLTPAPDDAGPELRGNIQLLPDPWPTGDVRAMPARPCPGGPSWK